MRTYKKVMVEQRQFVSAICDCCKNEFTDQIDLQEFLCYHNIGGYSSVFGDGEIMSLDLCQNCVKKLLGDYIQFHEGEG